jgi:hypothetical protein
MGDTRGKGYQMPAVENPPHEQKENFEVPEKDPDRLRSKLPRDTGQTAGIGSKVRNFPSQK